MQSAQVDQHVNERVLVRDGLTIAQPGALNAQRLGLGVDALGGRTLLVDILVDRALAVELMANARPDAGGQRGDAAFGPVLVLDRTGFTGWLWEDQGAGIADAFVFDAGGLAGEGEFEGHSQPGRTQGQALGIELALYPAPL